MSSWGLFQCNSACVCSNVFVEGPFSGVATGNRIIGTIAQYAGNPDAWSITTTDNTTGSNSVLDVWNIPNSWPKFNTAQSAVNENYGLKSCQDMPRNNSIQFAGINLIQGGPNWNTQNNVTTSTAWYLYSNPDGYTPNCSWQATELNYGDFSC